MPDVPTPEMPAKRYFELVDDKSNKFWEVWVDGEELTTHWGRIGTNGQIKTKTLASAEKARAERDKLISQKVAKGYQEITSEEPNATETVTGEPQVAAPETAEAETSEPEPETLPDLQSLIESVQHAITLGDMEEAQELLRNAQATLEQAPALAANHPDRMRMNMLAAVFQHTLEELGASIEQAAADDEAGVAGLPAEIHLEDSTLDPFVDSEAAWRVTESILEAGFEVVGDFHIFELPVVLRGFFRKPNTFVALYEMGEHQWVDLVVYNNDETTEEWSNVPSHDGLVPPWTASVMDPKADFKTLHEMMTAEHSGKKPLVLMPDVFVRRFQDAYATGRAWRASRDAVADATSDEAREIEEKVWAFAMQYMSSRAFYDDKPPESVPSGAALMKLSDSGKVEVLKACFRLADPVCEQTRYDTLRDLRERLLRRKLPYSDGDVEFLAEELKKTARDDWGLDKYILGALERYGKANRLSEKAKTLLRQARDRSHEGYFSQGAEKLKGRIDALVGDDAVRIPILPHEAWADAATEEIEQLPPEKRGAWVKLLQHCLTTKASKPSATWLKQARPLVEAVSLSDFEERVARWFPLVDKPRTPGVTMQNPDAFTIAEPNQDILRGLVWCCTFSENRQVARVLGALGIIAFRKIPQIGARAVRVGNACIFTLGSLLELGTIDQLAILKIRVKHIPGQKLIEKQLNAAAEQLGVPRNEVEEMAVPAYGLEEVGLRTEQLGEFTAELRVTGSRSTEIVWIKPDGKTQKSVPAAAKRDHAEELKELKTAAKDIEKMLPIQRERIDRMFLQQRTWPLATWRERYLDHPLVGTIARRIIWRFRAGDRVNDGIFLDDQIVGHDDQPLELTDDATVELWHPIDQPVDEVVAWRRWLESHQLRQPFKQAHREVYLLTDAERETGIYSNRFAAHILRQSQFRGLARTRDWSTEFLGPWDGADLGISKLKLEPWNLQAEFWVMPAGEEFSEAYGFLYVSTDQVRFSSPIQAEETESMPLVDVPPLVLSEVMRDVDLFVGVASVGNDPTWADGGPEGQYRDYWTGYSFGDLSASAQTRRDVLETLIPRLAIAAQCTLTDRFLVVQGELRTYKIHLGSTNICMEPNDEYLCIVPDRTSKSLEKIYLPFEGDNGLALILSKAFLLADDAKITDPTILSQIRHKGS